ncbi:MAG: MerR family transcriptional regulator [Solirubrobacterales bacterium]|nr:MerR family transcriptional regulator [Solirubrobacterales bacterium]
MATLETKRATGLTISDVAQETGLTSHTLRYYERAGLLAGVERNGSGHRRYTSEDVEWVILVTRLRATGMPIRLIRRYAELVRDGEGNEAERLALLEAHRAEVVARLDQLHRNLELIDYKIGLYRERACDVGAR